MAALVDTKYEGDSGRIHALKLSAASSTAAGTPPTAAVDDDLLPKISKSKREYGLRPRGVRLGRTVGTLPDTFRRYAFLPVLRATEFAGTGFAKGSTITISGVDWTVVAKIPEDYN